jgi:hypothetical protein
MAAKDAVRIAARGYGKDISLRCGIDDKTLNLIGIAFEHLVLTGENKGLSRK